MVRTILGVEIRGDGLLLRPIGPGDEDAIVAGLNDPDATRFLPSIPSPYTLADAEEWVERCAEAWRSDQSWPFAIVDEATGAFLGSVELHRTPPTVGYWVAAGERGRGVATQAVRLLCGWTKERPLRLTTHPDNLASQRVAEKAGFRRLGTTTDHPVFRDGTRQAALFELD
jgi:RimJ/RimL family protein N-acetyltransferase